jgi:hypothetical protein
VVQFYFLSLKIQFCDVAQSGNYPYVCLAQFGEIQNMKLNFFIKKTIAPFHFIGNCAVFFCFFVFFPILKVKKNYLNVFSKKQGICTRIFLSQNIVHKKW